MRALTKLYKCIVNNHNAYCKNLFDDLFSGNRRQFWKYIRTRRRKDSSVWYLNITCQLSDQFISDPKGKAATLSN